MTRRTTVSWAWLFLGAAVITLITPTFALAAVPELTGNPIADGILSTLLYSVIGMIMAFISYKVIDLVTPGHLGKDIAENSVALAILAGMTILGICIIIAAAIVG